MISVSGASEATGEEVVSAASCAATDGGVAGFLPFLPVRRPRREPARSAASRPDEAYFSQGKAILAAPRDYQVGTLRSISTPVRPPAISRSAVTVGLSLLSRRGAWPCANSRARYVAAS